MVEVVVWKIIKKRKEEKTSELLVLKVKNLTIKYANGTILKISLSPKKYKVQG